MSFRQNMLPMAIVVGVDEDGGFAKKGKIPWNEPEDLKNFQNTTKGGVCVMGRKTYEDMLEMMEARGKKEEDIKQILPGRDSYVLTRDVDYEPIGAKAVRNITDAVQDLKDDDHRTIFIIGGEKVYIEALAWVDTVYMTIVEGRYDCDKFFPVKVLTDNYKITDGSMSDNKKLKFVTYKKVR